MKSLPFSTRMLSRAIALGGCLLLLTLMIGCGSDAKNDSSDGGTVGGGAPGGGATPQLSFADSRKQRAEDIRRIAKAMHAFHREFRCFPPAFAMTPQGEPSLSWRVLLLPYLGHGDLLKKFNRAAKWDHPDNMKLLSQMPDVYKFAGDTNAKPGHTYSRVFVGNGAMFETADELRKPRKLLYGLPLTAATLQDGAANTLLIVEAGEAVPWTQPSPLYYDPDRPLPSFGGPDPHIFLMAFADSSSQMVRKNVREDKMRLAILRNDGQPFSGFDLTP